MISAVNGVAAGGGFVLTTMCDLRIASTAGSFTSIFSKRGLIAEHGMTWIVPRLVGAGAALDLLWSSRQIDAAEAHRIGLVQQVVEPDDLLAAARRYIVELAENVSPASLADTKRLVYEGFGVQYPAALEEIDAVQYAALDRIDAKEGAAALIEKRSPDFPRLGDGAADTHVRERGDELDSAASDRSGRPRSRRRGRRAARRVRAGGRVQRPGRRHLRVCATRSSPSARSSSKSSRPPATARPVDGSCSAWAATAATW